MTKAMDDCPPEVRCYTAAEVAGLSKDEIQEYCMKAKRAAFISLILKSGIIVLAIIAFLEGEILWVLAGAFALFTTFIPTIIKRHYQIGIPWVLELLIFLAILLHVGGGVLGLYDLYPNWDTLTHFVSTFMLGVVSLTVIYLIHVYWSGLTMDLRAIMVVTVFVGAFLGVVWELMEWAVDQAFGTTEQLGLDDTMKDLVMDMIGAFVAAVLGGRWIHNGSLQFMTADFGDALNERVFSHMKADIPARAGQGPSE
jgi:VanZ family protein